MSILNIIQKKNMGSVMAFSAASALIGAYLYRRSRRKAPVSGEAYAVEPAESLPDLP